MKILNLMFVVVVLKLSLYNRTNAQFFVAPEKPDTIHSFNGMSIAISVLNQDARAFNDSAAKYGYGRFGSLVYGIGFCVPFKLSDYFLAFTNYYLHYGFSAASEKYSSALWKAGFDGTYAYILFTNDVFRLYPLGGIAFQFEYMNIVERKSVPLAQLNPSQFQEPWRIGLTRFDFLFNVGIGADIFVANPYNRVYELPTGSYQMDMRIGMHLIYNFGSVFGNVPLLQAWSANGSIVEGLPKISTQGLAVRFMLTPEFRKIP